MNISVPNPMKDWVQFQVNTVTYENTSNYVRDLFRQDQEHRSKLKALQNAITVGIESGIVITHLTKLSTKPVKSELKKSRS